MDPESPTFLVVPCACCQGQPSLAARELDPVSLTLAWCCQACGQALDPEHPQARWVQVQDLDVLGFFVEGFEPEARHGEGGCRGGRCGVQQRG